MITFFYSHHRISQRDPPWADTEGGQGVRPPEKSQKYRVCLQYWSGSPEKSQSYQASINVGPSLAH